MQVDIGEEDVVHLRVYQDLQNGIKLSGMQYPKGRSHPITYFWGAGYTACYVHQSCLTNE